MNRNNFLPHVALALVVILIAAFAGQVRNWRKGWRSAGSRAIVAKPKLVGSTGETAPVSVSPKHASEVLVRFKPGTSAEQRQAIATRFNDLILDEIESVDELDRIEDEDGKDLETVIAEYRARPEVKYVEANYEIHLEPSHEIFSAARYPSAAGGPNDPLFGNQWALANTGQNGGRAGADISALQAWTTTRGDDSVVVAVLDSGVDYEHLDLADNIWTRPANLRVYVDRDLATTDDLHGFSAIGEDPMDENGHGTHCAGIIGATGDNGEGVTGVNWKVQIMPLKFMDASGSGTTADAIAAINYVIERNRAGVNVRIISASWGSTQRSQALEDVISKANDAGILFVAASGNSSEDTDRTPHYPSSYDLTNVISVAALDNNDQLTSFSNYGAKSVHIAAPGKDILSTWLENDFREASGTSMATPVVAGVAALVLAKNPKLSVDELRKRLLKSVDKLDGLKGKVESGGRINAAKAVAQ